MQVKRTNTSLFILWLCLTSSTPFIFYSWPGHPHKYLILACLAFMLIMILTQGLKVRYDRNIIIVFSFQILFYIFEIIRFGDFVYSSLCLQIISLLIVTLFIKGFVGYNKFARSYIIIIIIMGYGGVLAFFIHLIFGITPIFSVNYSGNGISYFLGLTCTNSYVNYENFRILRFSGFFDEPGAFALASIYALVLNKLYFNSQKFEIQIIVLAIFTFSLAFYFVCTAYILLFYLNKSNLKFLLFSGLIVILAVIYISYNKDSNSNSKKIYELTLKRFELDSDYNLSGNSRSSHTVNDKELFFENPLTGVGMNHKVSGSNLFSPLATYGISGFFIYYGLVLYLLLIIIFHDNKIRNTKLYFIIILNFGVRPEVTSLLIMLLLIAIIEKIKISQVN